MNTIIQDNSALTFKDRIEPYIGFIGPVAMILAVIIFMGIVEPARYFRASNMEIILLDAALYMPMAMAMTFVITQRGIDLSIGSVAALTGIVMAFSIKVYDFPAWIAVLIGIMFGAILGLINGLVITRLKVPDLIGTLAMDLVYRGFALILAKGLVLSRFPDLITTIGRERIPFFLPVPVLIGIATMIGGFILLRKTYFGRYTIAIGSSPEAAEMTGISVDRHRIYAYVLMGAAAGLAGVMLTGKLNAIQATSAPYFNLHVIAAVVVGGTSLFGGRGSLIGSFAGVMLLAMMVNALVTLRIEFFWQSVASGVVIVSSVALYTWLEKKDRDGARGLLAGLLSPDGLKTIKLGVGLMCGIAVLLILGFLFAGGGVPSN
ncbi:ABC transporter permease [Lentilitoribacter sp. Alg239-R112]|jgi:ribose transport system permease protein|uniref:ABC transporter permease n=1 Tax=Lentilitoribacter sp. Alg239-R112 TaxID=2305987 RepID=UPI0013A6E269|nr:ABC transporter permease [Lentilitoribacter sp. Alg239-R112]